MTDTVKTKLTQSLNLVTDALVDECNESIPLLFGNHQAWKVHDIKQDVVRIVARLSTRVFLGPELSSNEQWLRIARDYTVDAFTAAQTLLALPKLVQPAAAWLLPICQRLRKEVKEGRRLIEPIVDQ